MLDFFGIAADFDLNVMRKRQRLNGLTARVVKAVDRLFRDARPDHVIVHGDTTGALAAAQAAFNLGIPVAHVEAGLRTYDLANPWPEEFNRRAIDLFADPLFPPTILAADNLRREGIGGREMTVTGNTVIDALFWTRRRIAGDRGLRHQIESHLPPLDPGRPLVLVTAHRRENQGKPLHRICEAVRGLAADRDLQIVFAVHPSPAIRRVVHRQLDGVRGVTLIDALPYPAFIHLMCHARLILSDSGGIQEEATALGIPVILMRDTTERREGVAEGTVHVAGTDTADIVGQAQRALDGLTPALPSDTFGDERAAERIVTAMRSFALHRERDLRHA
ncbi:non-hydrolyzing UDP-N-acetylglucosamine 2-epimerase [Sphingomonas sp. ID0503]|uniref:non-hydrolyzing UDP-N-acetylglucosamine 2-epimerase n=1 Tax=Sphingomonas sp. ID0503 TaxID=3399691 RepID=UPI003AFA1F9C